MFKVLTLQQKEDWDNIVKHFSNYDIYYLSCYLLPLENYTNSKAVLFYYKKDNFEICYPMFINDISNITQFNNLLEKNKYFDMETPYGYGGFLVNNYLSQGIHIFYKKVYEYCKLNNIITQFIRFNPLSQNYQYSIENSLLINEKSTIFMDLSDTNTIWNNLDSKNRNMIRKATNNHIEICHENLTNKNIIDKFKELYKLTMDRNNADKFYYFDDRYFNDFITCMHANCYVFYAQYNGEIIASALIMKCNNNLHYFLSAANKNYLNLAPNNLLLYKVAVWGAENGYKIFHLGGGVSDNDRLFSFKKSFNRNGNLNFYIGSNIYDQEKFDYLVSLRKKSDGNFDLNRKYLIKYRQ